MLPSQPTAMEVRMSTPQVSYDIDEDIATIQAS